MDYLFCVALLNSRQLYIMSNDTGRTSSGPFYKHGLTLIPAWISYYIHYNVWGEIIYAFLNFNGCIVEVWEWMSNAPHTSLGMWLRIHVGINAKPC